MLTYVNPHKGDGGWYLQIPAAEQPIVPRADGTWETQGQLGAIGHPPQPGHPAIAVAAVVVSEAVGRDQLAKAAVDPNCPRPQLPGGLVSHTVENVKVRLPDDAR